MFIQLVVDTIMRNNVVATDFPTACKRNSFKGHSYSVELKGPLSCGLSTRDSIAQAYFFEVKTLDSHNRPSAFHRSNPSILDPDMNDSLVWHDGEA